MKLTVKKVPGGSDWTATIEAEGPIAEAGGGGKEAVIQAVREMVATLAWTVEVTHGPDPEA